MGKKKTTTAGLDMLPDMSEEQINKNMDYVNQILQQGNKRRE